MTDSKFFSSAKNKGEIYELREALNSTKASEKQDAVKKVIAAMTVGKDVSGLFTDVVNCMQTDKIDLKKLVYLYVLNYAKTQPEKAIMAVNSFVKDCTDPNPLIRALAVRTMGCIRVNKITEYLCEPLRQTLNDDDPYVRKTAAVCVAKLYDIDPDLVQEQGFIESLQDLLSDSNPMVVANAVAALSEMHENRPGAGIFEMSASTVSKLLTALNECTEWGQIFILDSLAIYAPKDQRELKSICERVAPRLQHVNAAVVLSAVKVIMKLMDGLADEEYKTTLTKKLAPPLVTLLSSEAEVQYVALRNINLIVQKRPEALADHMKVFFVKYNDPIYVKLEKLDVMIRLAGSGNISQVLAELKEYATEVDVDFVRKAVRAIGRCAIKVEDSAQRCVDTLLDLIQTKVNYVVQEAIIVIKDIFRKYPNRYESIIATLCENLDSLDEPEAKASMIWIVGEYADRIDNADELLESFLDNFIEESSQVQLQLLTAIVKLFLKRPTGTQPLVQRALTLATQECDNPDLRDRGFIYWRLLLTDPAAAKAVVLADKPLIAEETDLLEPSLLDELLTHVSSLASVYHKPPSTFVDNSAGHRPLAGADEGPEEVDIMGEESSSGGAQPDLLNLGGGSSGGGGGVDLLGGALGGLDLGGGGGGAAPMVRPKEMWLDSSAGAGLQVQGTVARRGGKVTLDISVSNMSGAPMSGLAFQFNKNSFALTPAAAVAVPDVAAGGTAQVYIAMSNGGQLARMDPLNKLMVAVKNNVGVYYFSFNVPFHTLLSEDGKLEKKDYLSKWQQLGDANERKFQLTGVNGGVEKARGICSANNVFEVAKRNENGQDLLYCSMRFNNDTRLEVLAELTFPPGSTSVSLALKTTTADLFPACHEMLQELLGTAAAAPPPSLF